MNNYKYLNIKGTSLEESQLEKYLKQRAEEIGRASCRERVWHSV